MDLQTDREGNFITRPVTGWGITDVAGMFLMIAIEYAENQEQLETCERKQLQHILTGAMALETALKKAACILLSPIPNGTLLQ